MKYSWQTTSWLRKLLCPHPTMRVIRWHANAVRPDMRGKILYTDRHGVLNFVQCCHCNKIFPTDQVETLFEEQRGESMP